MGKDYDVLHCLDHYADAGAIESAAAAADKELWDELGQVAANQGLEVVEVTQADSE